MLYTVVSRILYKKLTKRYSDNVYVYVYCKLSVIMGMNGPWYLDKNMLGTCKSLLEKKNSDLILLPI